MGKRYPVKAAIFAYLMGAGLFAAMSPFSIMAPQIYEENIRKEKLDSHKEVRQADGEGAYSKDRYEFCHDDRACQILSDDTEFLLISMAYAGFMLFTIALTLCGGLILLILCVPVFVLIAALMNHSGLGYRQFLWPVVGWLAAIPALSWLPDGSPMLWAGRATALLTGFFAGRVYMYGTVKHPKNG